MKLNQLIAILTGRKSETEVAMKTLRAAATQPALFAGMQRTYRPLDEVNGEKFPGETKKVQQRVHDLAEQARSKLSGLWDLTFAQDSANQQAKADVVVDGKTIVSQAPVSFLLFMEKQVGDLLVFFGALPTPDSSESWSHDPNTGLLRSQAVESLRTRKEPTHYKKADATKEHPAQVEFFYKDVPIGTWTTTQFSSAIPADEKEAILVRLKALRDAVKIARESANMQTVAVQKVADPVFDYVMTGS